MDRCVNAYEIVKKLQKRLADYIASKYIYGADNNVRSYEDGIRDAIEIVSSSETVSEYRREHGFDF